MRYRFFTADVFTDRMFGGNQLAVLPEASGIDSETMLQITREFNYSETVFVLPPLNPAHTRKLRIFSPGRELSFAGHPTVGTAFVLASIGEIPIEGTETKVVFEEGVGPVPVRIRLHGGVPVFAELSAAKMPEIGPEPPSRVELAATLSLDPAELSERYPVLAVSCGTPFLFVPLRDLDALGKARINLQAWENVLRDWWTGEVFVFTPLAEGNPDFRVRMFAPGAGIVEDPATGSAAAAFGGYLGRLSMRDDAVLRWKLEQGVEMGRPSLLYVEVERVEGEVVAVRVGGNSVMVSEGWIDLPAADGEVRAT